jgi:hypothetical protein
MIDSIDNLRRIDALERRVRHLQEGLIFVLIAVVGAVLMARPLAQTSDGPLRVKGLIIEDSDGRARIMLGAPIPGDGRSTNLRTGLRIND